MKRLVITIAFLVGIIGFAQADNHDPKEKKADTLQVLSPEEIELETVLEAELNVNIDEVIAELNEQPVVEGIKIYDLAGNVICEQSGEIDYQKIPFEADLVMTEKGIQYYVIVQ